METLFDQYKELNINGSLICLEQVEDIYSYFCYPTNAKAIGFEGSIMSVSYTHLKKIFFTGNGIEFIIQNFK